MGSRCITCLAKWLLPLSSFYFAQTSCAQTIENVKANFLDGKVIINYDLKADSNAAFVIELYGSHNNYSVVVRLAQGDVGNSIKPGVQKRIEWDIKKDLKDYKGEIIFELHADPAILPWVIVQPSLKTGLRRGKAGTILWLGGKPTQDVSLELYQGTNLVQAITSSPVANTKKYEWALPAKMKTGGGYTIKLSSGKEGVTSATFKINSKIPLYIKLLPIAVIGGLIPVIFKKPPPPVIDPTEGDLKGAPGIPPN